MAGPGKPEIVTIYREKGTHVHRNVRLSKKEKGKKYLEETHSSKVGCLREQCGRLPVNLNISASPGKEHQNEVFRATWGDLTPKVSRNVSRPCRSDCAA